MLWLGIWRARIVDVQVGAALAGAPNAHTGAVWAFALLPDGAGFTRERG